MRRRIAMLLAPLLLAWGSALAAVPLNDDILAPAAPRPAPRSRPESAPVPEVYSSRSVAYFARSADGKGVAVVERGDNGDELWLYPALSSQELPRLLVASPVRLASPSFNRSGTLLAYVDFRDDVKGDVWLLDLAEREPRRLTGKEGGEDAPLFDRESIIYHRQLPGSERRELLRLDLQSGRSEILPLGIDAAFASLSPDGRALVFVSRSADQGGDLWLWDSEKGSLRQLTSGAPRDLYPAWEGEKTVLFTRFSSPEGEEAPGRIYRLHLERAQGVAEAFPLTAGTFSALAPAPAGERFLFVAGSGGGGQIMSLPASGEIPQRADVAAQWDLARLLLDRQPPDPAHAALACSRVLERETVPTREGALASLALSRLMEQGGESGSAEEFLAVAVRRYAAFPEQAALAEIARLRLQAARRCGQVVVATRRQEVLREARAAMAAAAAGKGGDAVARALVDAALLYGEFGAGAADQLEGVALCEKAASVAGAGRSVRAEAALRRGILLARLEKGEGALTALVEVARDFADQEEWAEAAIAAVIEQVAPGGGDRRLELAALAERYRSTLPRLAMGGWNRIGDLAYRENEWAKAKDAYRTVLERFAPLPTPTAAARFALAEILYREERYAEATALYEKEMAEQPEDAPLYQLARAGYIRKTVAAGENLYRLGELAAARSLFLDLIRYDGRSLEAHRGYIKSVAAQGQAAELLKLYRTLLARYPDDAVLLYATGLCRSYLPGREALEEAESLVASAARRMPDSEYPPQTRGYLAEVSETVYGARGGLERAMDLYRRARLLNRSQEHPENRANLDLNIGNVAFLLGRNATAWSYYGARFSSGIPFDNPDTELLFLQRYAAVAFQMREKEAPVTGYSRALQLAEGRLDPARPLDLFGRLTRRTVERLFGGTRSAEGEKRLAEQQEIIASLERMAATPPIPPPSAGWRTFEEEMRALLERQKALLASAPSWNSDAGRHGDELQGMAEAVQGSLEAVPRLVETSAEIHDRLGLALLEADRFAEAREQFDAAFRLNEGLGHTGNLAANRRSAAVSLFRQAEASSGEERVRLLRIARESFRETLSLLERHPPRPKSPPKRSGGLISLGADVALDKGGATQAAFGFSPLQEKRLVQSHLARIAAELGDPAEAAALLQGQLSLYPADDGGLAAGDRFGVALLSHRSGHLQYALGRRDAAAAAFRRSLAVALQGGNPVSAMLNQVNWGELLLESRGEGVEEFLRLEAQTTSLASAQQEALPSAILARYHNDVGVLKAALASLQREEPARQSLLYSSLVHFNRALSAAGQKESGELRVAARLNRGAVLAALGLFAEAQGAWSKGIEEARACGASSLEWRGLAALGRFAEALAVLEQLPPTEFDLRRGELAERFSPYLEQETIRDAEAGFALLERLSEIERVQILARPLLSLDDPAVADRLAAAAPHLAEIDRLSALHAGAPAAEKEYLQMRLQQEQTLLDALVGKGRELLPSFYAQGGGAVLRLAAAAAAVSEATAAAERFPQLRKRFSEVSASFAKGCAAGKEGRLCRFLVPERLEAIDLIEGLPGETLLRFTPLEAGRWLLFTLGKTGVKGEAVPEGELQARLSAGSSAFAAFEEPWRFPGAKVKGWGLSASHLLRAVQQRKPFRRQVLDAAGWWPAGEPFLKLPADGGGLADAHAVVLPAAAGMLPHAPSTSGGGDLPQPLWENAAGERRSLLELGNGENLALLVAPRAGVQQAYALGQMAALLGIPTLLVGDKGEAGGFPAAYGTAAAAAAAEKLAGRWLLLGDPGPDAAQALLLGKRRFAEYGKSGVKAHNEGRYPQALALFEGALAVAAEQRELAKHRSTLHRYARESAYAAGDTARALQHAGALVEVIAKEKPFSAEHAEALLRLGVLQGKVEKFAAAAASLKEGAGIYADLGMVKEQASVVSDFGAVMENAVDFPAARSLFEEAAGLSRTLGDDSSLAGQYRNLGRIYDLRLNRWEEAEKFYADAGDIYRRTGNSPLEAETLLERGRCRRLLGDFAAADELYRQALSRIGEKELRTRMRVVLEQANNAWFQGRYQEAFDLREQVEKRAVAEKWPLEQVMARNTGGLIWWTLGNSRRALLELQGALERAGKLEVRRDEVATTLNNIGLVRRESGDYTGALQALEQALAIDRTLGSRWAMAYDLRNIAQTRLKMGEPSAAVPLLAEAATMAGEIGDQVNRAKIMLARGDAEAALKKEEAAASYSRALELADAMALREVRWRALFGLARLQQGRGEHEAALASYRKALETVEGLRAEIRLDQLKDGFLADKMDVYGGLVGLLVDLGREEEAFSVAERSRARNLIDILGRQRLSLAGGVEQELYDRQNSLKQRILEQETLAAQAASAQKGMYTGALEQLQAQYQDLLLEIERQRPELLSLVKVDPLSLQELKGLLEPGVVLLSYYQLPERLLCWRISREEARLFILKASSAGLAESISTYRRMLQNLEPLERKSRELFDLLLAAPLSGAGEVGALGIIPHGSLHYLAFATLHDGKDYVVDRQRLFHLPAASVLRYTLARRQPEKNLRVLAVGNPDLGTPSLELPFAEREVGTLCWNYPEVTTLTRERATESWVRRHINEFGIIHLASHGEFDPVNPLFSAVRLAADETADGRLQAEEVFGLELKADLVVLSACQTGLGDVRGGDDVVGMNRAFLFAGTHSLMSSLWRVSDVSTGILMKQFYRNYTVYDKGESLARAMRHVKNRYPHPGYWGAFVLTGDYR